jgi:hypothetical protein
MMETSLMAGHTAGGAIKFEKDLDFAAERMD